MQSDIAGDESAPGQSGDDARIILDAIRRIVQLLRRSSTATEKRIGLSAAQLFVLHKLRGGETLSVGDLANRTLTSQSSVSEVVQKLVSAGYVTRTRSARDARSVELSLTDTGRQLVQAAPEAPQDSLLAGLAKMSPASRKQLGRLLSKLVRETGLVGDEVKMLFADEDHSTELNREALG